MALTYDFDMFDVIPGDGEDDPSLGRFMTEIGFKPDTAARKVALFRDQRTADALRDAPEGLREFFLASGFGLNTYQSGARAGFYPQQDEEARLDIIRRLTENAEIYPLPRLTEGTDAQGFVLMDFLAALAAAQPMEMPRHSVAAALADDLLSDDAEEEIDLSAAFEGETRPDPVPHDLRHPHEVRPKVMPPMFDTAPPDAVQPRKKFWQNKFSFLSLSIAMTVAAFQITSALGYLV
jgi:hypothetical protein